MGSGGKNSKWKIFWNRTKVRTSDKKEQGERGVGFLQTRPPLAERGPSPFIQKPGKTEDNTRFPEEKFIRPKGSDKYKVGQNSTTRSNVVTDKQKSSQLNKVWRANMWILILIFSWFKGTAICTSTVPKYTVLDMGIGVHRLYYPGRNINIPGSKKMQWTQKSTVIQQENFIGVLVTPTVVTKLKWNN